MSSTSVFDSDDDFSSDSDDDILTSSARSSMMGIGVMMKGVFN